MPYVTLPGLALFEPQPQLSIDDILSDPSLLTGVAPETLLERLGWTGGAPTGWVLTRLSQGVNNKGLGLVLRQTITDENGNVNLTGIMLRWYPGSTRAGHNDPNWKVSNGETKFTGPNGEGFKTPQSEFWNQPGTPEEVLREMSGESSPTPPTVGGDGGLCACGEPDPMEWFSGGGGGDGEDFPIGFFGE